MAESKKRILVMDDEEIVADIAQQMLVFMGYEVEVVEHGEDAVKNYRAAMESGNTYSVVIMDLNIPRGMGGVEAVKEVLALDKSAKVLASTGYSSDPIMQNYGQYGFTGCIAKPFDLKGLQDAIDTALAS